MSARKLVCKYEYKRLFSPKLWCWIAICCLVNIVLWGFKYKETEQDTIYREVVNEYTGIATKEKIKEIFEKTEYYSQVLEQHVFITEEYAKGNISEEEFQHFMDDYKYAKKYINGWLRLQENAARFEVQDKDTWFFYDVGWNRLFENDVQIIFVFLFITLLIPYFYQDKDSNLCFIYESYFDYAKIKKLRVYYAIILFAVLQVIWIVVEIVTVLFMTSIPDMASSVCSLEIYAGVKDSISVIHFYTFKAVLLFLKRVVDVLFTYLMAEKLKSKMMATIIILIYLMITNLYYVEVLKILLK